MTSQCHCYFLTISIFDQLDSLMNLGHNLLVHTYRLLWHADREANRNTTKLTRQAVRKTNKQIETYRWKTCSFTSSSWIGEVLDFLHRCTVVWHLAFQHASCPRSQISVHSEGLYAHMNTHTQQCILKIRCLIHFSASCLNLWWTSCLINTFTWSFLLLTQNKL